MCKLKGGLISKDVFNFAPSSKNELTKLGSANLFRLTESKFVQIYEDGIKLKKTLDVDLDDLQGKNEISISWLKPRDLQNVRSVQKYLPFI
jgi:hypothetical protein